MTMAKSGYICPECGEYTSKTLAHTTQGVRGVWIAVWWSLLSLFALGVAGVPIIAFAPNLVVPVLIPLFGLQALAGPVLAGLHAGATRVPRFMRKHATILVTLVAFVVNLVAALVVMFVLAQVAASM